MFTRLVSKKLTLLSVAALQICLVASPRTPGTSQTITFDAIPNQVLGISPFPIAARASSGLPVTFVSTTPTVCKNSSDLVILLNLGTCSITASQGGNSTWDAATPVTRSFTVSVATPAGVFAAAPNSPYATAYPFSVAVGDFNGDGIQDLAVVNQGYVYIVDGSVTVLLGNGSGGFTPAPGSPIAVGPGPASVAVGDFNGDGIQDLVVADEASNSLTLLLGDGSGRFTATTIRPNASNRPHAVVVGDFNGDGIQDLAVTNINSMTVTVLLGNGSGGFTAASGSPFAVGSATDSMAVGEFNGDGIQDLAIANSFGNSVTVLLGNGLGGFTPAQGSPFAVGAAPNSVVVGDFNGDGNQDLATANSLENNVTVLLGNGSGGFTPATGSPFSVGSGPGSLVAVDFNGDGIQDLIAANSGGSSVTVLLGDGSGGFTPAPASPFTAGAGPGSLAVGDFNGDGIQDIATANNSTNNLTVLLGVPARPILSIAKSHTGNFTQAQTNAAYTVTVANQGGSPASGIVTVTETVPTGLTLDSMSGTDWTCVLPTCTRVNDLAAGSSYPAIAVTVDVSNTATSPQVNSVSVSGGGSATATATDSTTILVLPPAILSITSTHVGSFVLGQENATYTLTVSNASSTVSTSGTVTVTDTLPAGLYSASIAGTGWSCGYYGPCSRNDVLSPGSSYPPIVLTVGVAPNAASPETNQVTVSGGGSATSTASDITTIVATPPAGSLVCTAAGAGTPQLRPEGYTELLGDILITCTGGQTMAPGTPIPTTNVTVSIAPSVPITSRLLGSNAASEALLLIDEPGSGISTGPTGGYGSQAPQNLCTSAQQQAGGGSLCPAFVGLDNSGQYEVAVTGIGGATAAANVYQGRVGAANAITFYSVPILPPGTAGGSRIFRITNVRIPATAQSGFSFSATVSVSSPSVLLFSANISSVGIGGTPMHASVALQNTFVNTISTSGPTLAATIKFTEGFANAFKTRVAPGGSAAATLGNTLYAAQAPNTSAPANQNIPGGIYGGFAQNSESGFIFPALTGTINGVAYTAGLADYGTRLKAVFYNIPVGLTLYVSTVSTGTAPNPIGGTSTLPYAVLVATSLGEALPDGSPFGAIPGFFTGSDGLPVIADAANSAGAITAVWEVTNSNPAAVDSLSFNVYIAYAASPPSANFPYGLPAPTNYPLGAPVNDVHLTFAPEPGGGTFTTSNATVGQVPTPRFAVLNLYQGNFAYISPSSVSITMTHSGNFVPGQSGAAYTATVNNIGTGPTSGLLTVTENIPTGLTLVSMAGAGWTCLGGDNKCTRSDALDGGASYPPITVTVDVAGNAPSSVTNQVTVSGGGAPAASASDPTTIGQAYCGYSISPASIALGSSGGSGDVVVSTSSPQCSWQASSNAGWIYAGLPVRCTFCAPASVFTYSVPANSGPDQRSGTISLIANNGTQATLTVTQAGQTTCTYAINSSRQSFNGSGGSTSVQVTAPAGCAWNMTGNPAWLAFPSGTSGAGNGALAITVAANTGLARSATLTIAGQPFSISQGAVSACGAVDVTGSIPVSQGAMFLKSVVNSLYSRTITLTNRSGQTIPAPIYLVMDGLPVFSSAGCQYGCGVTPGPPVTHCQSPSSNGSDLIIWSQTAMTPGQSIQLTISFGGGGGALTMQHYTTRVLSGTPNQ